jgi:5-bromo-4-chloroindolyl phosphate hydrolysis protein
MKIPSSKRSTEIDSSTLEALSDTEKQIFSSLQEWEEFFEPMSKSTVRDRKSKKGAENTKVNLDEVAVQLVDNLMATLAELRNELKETGQQNAPMG